MFFTKLCHTEDGSHGKYPVKTFCLSDDLSGDMLAPSWPNLVITEVVPKIFPNLNVVAHSVVPWVLACRGWLFLNLIRHLALVGCSVKLFEISIFVSCIGSMTYSKHCYGHGASVVAITSCF